MSTIDNENIRNHQEMRDRCREDRRKELEAVHAKELEMRQKQHKEIMAEEERLQKLDEEKREEQKAKLLERGKLASTVLSSRPRITWRVDETEMQHCDGFSKSTGSTEREKSGTSDFSEIVSAIIEAENLLDGFGAHPETIPSLIDRILNATELSLELEDSTSAEHFQLQLMAERTKRFLLSPLFERKHGWQEYKRTSEEIKKFFEESRHVFDSFPTKEMNERRGLMGQLKLSIENIRDSISKFEKLEELFTGDENRDSVGFSIFFNDEDDSHKKSYAFEVEFREMERELKCLQNELCHETEQRKYFIRYTAEIKTKVDHIEELTGLLNQNQSINLPKIIGNALKSLDEEIEKVENDMKKCELHNKFVSVNFDQIEDLRSRLEKLKDEFAEALKNQPRFSGTIEKANQREAILEMFSKLTPEDARNLSAKLQSLYGAPVAKPEEQGKILNTVDKPADESEQEDPVHESVAADEPIDP